jgi:hypothetical protein
MPNPLCKNPRKSASLPCPFKRRKKYQEMKMRWDLKRWNMDNERRKLEKKHTADKKKNEETKKI